MMVESMRNIYRPATDKLSLTLNSGQLDTMEAKLPLGRLSLEQQWNYLPLAQTSNR
jgi:hypothetical protein